MERNIGPDATVTLDFALSRLNDIIKNLNIYPKKMLDNLKLTNGLFFSQRVLIELTKNGLSRELAYKVVQKHAMESWKNNSSFYQNVANDNIINKKILSVISSKAKPIKLLGE